MVSKPTYNITYHLTGDNVDWTYEARLDSNSQNLVNPTEKHPPPWTELSYKQCSNCPLKAKEHSHCPQALQLSALLKQCSDLISYEKVTVTVTTEQRTTTKRTAAHQAISSIMGLVIATSGCPHTQLFRPMARFHLPFADEEETLFRVASTFLLLRYFQREGGESVELSLEGLKEIYENIGTMNRDFSKRIANTVEKDAPLNALISLDMLTHFTKFGLENSLQNLRPFFQETLKEIKIPTGTQDS